MMRRGANSIIVGAVTLIAIAVIISVGVMFMEPSYPYTPYEKKEPVRIDVQPINISAGTFLVENLEPERSVTLSQLETTTGEVCGFGGQVSLGPDEQAVCTLDVPRAGEIVFYGEGVRAVTVIAG